MYVREPQVHNSETTGHLASRKRMQPDRVEDRSISVLASMEPVTSTDQQQSLERVSVATADRAWRGPYWLEPTMPVFTAGPIGRPGVPTRCRASLGYGRSQSQYEVIPL